MNDEDTVLAIVRDGALTVEEAAICQLHGLGLCEYAAPWSYAETALAAEQSAVDHREESYFELVDFLRGNALSPAERERVLASGMDAALMDEMAIVGDIGTARVSLSRDGSRFSPEGPDGRLLLAVRDDDFEVVDVVALASHDENQWSLLTGHGEMLGAWHLEAAHRALGMETPARLSLYSTPWDWLRAGGDGVCVLDWSGSAICSLRGLGERAVIEVEGAAARDRLKAMLKFGGNPMVAARASQFERAG